jgi:hypothetical protein
VESCEGKMECGGGGRWSVEVEDKHGNGLYWTYTHLGSVVFEDTVNFEGGRFGIPHF